MTMKIICLAGLIGSGKDTVADYIASKYSYHIIHYSDMLREICRREGLGVTRDNLQNLRIKYGNTFLAEAVVERIKKSDEKKFILTPLRRSEDFLIPKKEFGSAVKMVLVDAPPKLRFERLKNRQRENDPKDFNEFKRQESREFSIYDFDKTFSFADYTIDNSGTIKELKQKIDKIMEKI